MPFPARADAHRNRALSAIISPAYQSEAVQRLKLPFPILSDRNRALARAIKLPTFSVAGMILLKRMALVIDAGVIAKSFYPVFPPDKSAEEVIAWLRASR